MLTRAGGDEGAGSEVDVAYGASPPLDRSRANHSKLGRLKMQSGDARTAVREFRAAIAAGSLDPASAHSDLAESYLAVGDKVQARRAVLAAIEVAPGYPRAQELLLKVIGQ